MGFEFIDDYDTFLLENPDDTSSLYFPLTNCGGIMSSVTPRLGGDSKSGQHHFLLEPVSSRDLDTGIRGRNIWCKIEGKGVWSAVGNSALQQAKRYGKEQEKCSVTAGKLWHNVHRTSSELGISADVLSFCPASGEQAEVMRVTFRNISDGDMTITPIVAIPIYGRSADNQRDHRHVTSLLNRIRVVSDGVEVTPTLSFDERGHRINHVIYGVYARGEKGELPEGCCPVEEQFVGEGGSLLWPEAVVTEKTEYVKEGYWEGYEAIGAIRFQKVILKAKESRAYQVVLSFNREGKQYLEKQALEQSLQETKDYWENITNIRCKTGNRNFDSWMGWVAIQPELRRIFGCSFLPHHDYGRGGRGWRDLWQDSLALILSNPQSVRENLIQYFGGVRMDGSNATIIGRLPGEFIADRNSIVRVWMDHGYWPFLTTNLYLNQTGDYGLLLEKNTYFKDRVACRGESEDKNWDESKNCITDRMGNPYEGTVLEHLLIQNLTAFYDVGVHNHMRLRGGDWNDALDMAKDNGESVAFTAAYSGNLKQLADVLQKLYTQENIHSVKLAEELLMLIQPQEGLYASPQAKQELLANYCEACRSGVTGSQKDIPLEILEQDLRRKASWIQQNIRTTELVTDNNHHFWFNGYYDNQAQRTEGVTEKGVRMMLTSQVFPIISGTATDEQITQIVQAADAYLYDEKIGGYRLNTDFGELKLDMGRMFGFAYGHKENGAVFCHMAVMYAYGLYRRDFAREGYKVLNTLFSHAMDFEKSRIYPGIPEYFNEDGRGLYTYLTGAGSWMMFTVLTEMFGVRGQDGNLLLAPKLLAEQFGQDGSACITCRFAERNLRIVYVNKDHRDIGDYEVEDIAIDGISYPFPSPAAVISRKDLENLDENGVHVLRVTLA